MSKPLGGPAGKLSRNPVYSVAGRVLWDPSQSGGLAECLHMHHQRVFFSGTWNFSGWRPVPLWEPSQNGCPAERPQAHQPYIPASTSKASGFLSQTIGFSDMGRDYTRWCFNARRKMEGSPAHGCGRASGGPVRGPGERKLLVRVRSSNTAVQAHDR